MDTSFLLKILDIVTIAIQLVVSIISLVRGVSVSGFALVIMVIAIGMALICTDFDILKVFTQYFGFVQPLLWRGTTFILLALLLWVNPSDNALSIFLFVVDLVMIAIGIIYIIFGILSCSKKGDKGKTT